MEWGDEINRQREFAAAVTRNQPTIQSIHQAKKLAFGTGRGFQRSKTNNSRFWRRLNRQQARWAVKPANESSCFSADAVVS